MWAAAWPAIAAGDVDCDPQLARLDGGAAPVDERRGLTLVARPGPALAARIDDLLDRLEACAPGQYRQPRADLHMTLLSLFTVSADYAPQLARLDDYRAAARAALEGVAPFEVDFRGVTVSRGAVLAQGFPRDAVLATLRERLRAALRERGLDGSVDGRYRLVTAHASLLRFARPLARPADFAAALADMRTLALGTLRVDALELVVNDWYMTQASVEVVQRFALQGATAG